LSTKFYCHCIPYVVDDTANVKDSLVCKRWQRRKFRSHNAIKTFQNIPQFLPSKTKHTKSHKSDNYISLTELSIQCSGEWLLTWLTIMPA